MENMEVFICSSKKNLRKISHEHACIKTNTMGRKVARNFVFNKKKCFHLYGYKRVTLQRGTLLPGTTRRNLAV